MRIRTFNADYSKPTATAFLFQRADGCYAFVIALNEHLPVEHEERAGFLLQSGEEPGRKATLRNQGHKMADAWFIGEDAPSVSVDTLVCIKLAAGTAEHLPIWIKGTPLIPEGTSADAESLDAINQAMGA
jgi:hypothetical protein